tara:strand:- start:18132 stop:18779 length:648 start_codon:yes stop_codon:yes gene_type:complete
MKYIQEQTIGKAWIKAMQLIINNGFEGIYDGNDKILEHIPVIIEITQPKLTDTIIQKYAKKESLDFMMNNFVKMEPILTWGYSYAQRLYDYDGTNQINEIINILKKKPNAKSATINLLCLKGDKEHKPCLTSLDFKVRRDTLIIMGNFRSQDIGKKMYADAVELYKIGRYISKQLGLKKIIVMHIINSAHIYMKDLNNIYKILDSLRIKYHKVIN